MQVLRESCGLLCECTSARGSRTKRRFIPSLPLSRFTAHGEGTVSKKGKRFNFKFNFTGTGN